MNGKDYLLCKILDCEVLDVNYLTDIIDKNEIPLEELNLTGYWKSGVNGLVEECYHWIAQDFLNRNEVKEEVCLHTIYDEIDIDSHIWFEDGTTQALFKKQDYNR